MTRKNCLQNCTHISCPAPLCIGTKSHHKSATRIACSECRRQDLTPFQLECNDQPGKSLLRIPCLPHTLHWLPALKETEAGKMAHSVASRLDLALQSGADGI